MTRIRSTAEHPGKETCKLSISSLGRVSVPLVEGSSAVQSALTSFVCLPHVTREISQRSLQKAVSRNRSSLVPPHVCKSRRSHHTLEAALSHLGVGSLQKGRGVSGWLKICSSSLNPKWLKKQTRDHRRDGKTSIWNTQTYWVLLRISEFEKVKRQKPKVRSEDDEVKARGTDFCKSLREAKLRRTWKFTPMQRTAQGLRKCVWDSKVRNVLGREEAGRSRRASSCPFGSSNLQTQTKHTPYPLVKSELLAARLTPVVAWCMASAQ